MSSVKNYSKQGGEEWVVGGQLEIVAGGKLTFQGKEIKLIAGQSDSAATTVAALKDDLNALLKKLFISGLMVVDKSGLIAAIAAAQVLLDAAVVGEGHEMYSQETYDTFETAIETAQAVVNDEDVDQNSVTSAVTTLDAAVSAFEAAEIVVDKSTLGMIGLAQDTLDGATVGTEVGEYPQEAYDTFETAIATAQTVFDDANASQAVVDGAVTTLGLAVSAFEDAEIME